MAIVTDWQDQTKSISQFRIGIRAAVRGLWAGQIDLFTFVDSMLSTIERRLAQAWDIGARECGISRDEMTLAELEARQDFINSQFEFLFPFGKDIEARNRASGVGRLREHLVRSEVWINRYEQAKNQGKAMACRDKKLKWILGVAEHCGSCLKLNGRVKRASFWQSSGVLPRVANASFLDCGGWRCQCSLIVTQDPVTPGPLPNLP